MQYFYVVTLTYFVTVAFIKLAIVYQWIHLFVPRHTRNAFWWTCQTIGWMNWLACMIMMFMVAFGCKPIAKFYNPLLLGTCVDTLPTIYIAPAINLVFDIVALVLPQKVIWGLQLSLKKRLGISFLFALGLLYGIPFFLSPLFSSVATSFLTSLSRACLSAALRIPASVKFTRSQDNTYNIAATELWCLAEMSAGLLIYSVPSAPAGLKRVKDAAVTSTQRMRGSSNEQSGNVSKLSTTGRSTGRSTTGHRSMYREIDEIPLTSIQAPSRTRLYGQDEEDKRDFYGNEQGITRTTHIAMTSDVIDMK